MYQFMYWSRATAPMDEPELLDLLHVSQTNNNRNRITGLLVYFNQSFWQVFEGQKEDAVRLMEAIKADTRHYAVTIIHQGEIREREFGDWSMGLEIVGAEDIRKIDGFQNIQTVDDFIGISAIEGVPPRMLKAFYDGTLMAGGA